jgi:hypothetical protein
MQVLQERIDFFEQQRLRFGIFPAEMHKHLICVAEDLIDHFFFLAWLIHV